MGDFGYDYETLKDVDPKHHVFIGGNHENYDKIKDVPNHLGDFGYTVNFNGVDFFYYRGAYTVDPINSFPHNVNDRIIGVNWWKEEELKIESFFEARELYRSIKPDLVLTHECPEEVTPSLIRPGARVYQNMTSYFLQELFNIHQPKFWYFGHHHKSWQKNVRGTNFRCLNILETASI